MNSSPYQFLAKEFVDLWQKQISSVVSDKQFIHAMLDLLKTAQNPNASKAPHTNAAHAADAPVADHGVLAELALRVAMCEKRLAALEQSKAPRAKPAAKRKPAAKPKAGSGNSRGSKSTRR